MLRKWVLYLSLTLASLLASSGFAQTDTERILKFSDIIIVNDDASIEVTEAISVFANRNKIIHGLKRQLPLHYTDSYGTSHHANYRIQRILLNEKVSSYHVEASGDLFNIYIGNKNIELAPGVYRFTIRYRVENAVNFLQDVDEFYWNVTGNDWALPIEKAQVYIQLPKHAEIARYAGYTGVRGAKGQNFQVTRTSENEIAFITTAPLSPGEGLTVAVAWQKGIVKQPTVWEEAKIQFRTNRGQLVILEICFFLLCYYLLAWYYHGRDPHRGVVIPLFEPPENLPPTDMRYIMRMGFDRKMLAAAVVSMATKGFLRINNKDDEFSLTKLNQKQTTLSDSEKLIANDLFKNGETIKLNRDNRDQIIKSLEDLSVSLKNKYANRYFVNNKIYLVPGILLTLLAFFTAFLSVRDNSDAVTGLFMISAWSVACFVLCYRAFTVIQDAIEYPSFLNIFGAIASTIFAGFFLIAEMLILLGIGDPVLFFAIPLLFMAVLINIAFYYLLKRPTKDGREVMDKILGFKMFLGTTERYRLEQLNPPKKTPELFEKMLPYAIALGVENQWASQFTEVLAQAAAAGNPYQPAWYAGPNFSPNTISSFPAFLNTSLNDSLSTSTSSSSASGGGGFSGGGGGGGGGGGW